MSTGPGSSDPDEFLNEGGGNPTIKLNNPGSIYHGDVIKARVGVQRKYGTKEPDYWDDGTPKKQLILDVQIDWSKSQDITVGQDGDRPEVGTRYTKPAEKEAIREAVQASNGKLADGGTLTVKRGEDEKPSQPGLAGKQTFKARFEPRQVDVDDDLDFD